MGGWGTEKEMVGKARGGNRKEIEESSKLKKRRNIRMRRNERRRKKYIRQIETRKTNYRTRKTKK